MRCIEVVTTYLQTIEGKALSRVEHWSETHRHPYKEYIDNRRVNAVKFFLKMG